MHSTYAAIYCGVYIFTICTNTVIYCGKLMQIYCSDILWCTHAYLCTCMLQYDTVHCNLSNIQDTNFDIVMRRLIRSVDKMTSLQIMELLCCIRYCTESGQQ